MPTTLILGASRGIGLELARQGVAAREQVIATARTEAGLQALRQLGAEALALDVAMPASMVALAHQLEAQRIDTAWYVAGVMSHGDARQPPSQAEFDRVLHTNVLGAMQAIALLAPRLEATRGRFGFLSSSMGQIGSVSASNSWLYRVSKAALNMAVASACHSHPKALFLILNPGWVRTDMGGAGAPLGVRDCVAQLRVALASATPADSGRFINHDGSSMTAW